MLPLMYYYNLSDMTLFPLLNQLNFPPATLLLRGAMLIFAITQQDPLLATKL